jgi:phosphoglycerol transferase MdoB-like AlkP superfamily enzyme
VAIIAIAFYIDQLLWGFFAIAIIFWLFMLYDCLQRDAGNFPGTGGNEKLIWVIALVFLNFIGAVLYYFMVKMQDISNRIRSKSGAEEKPLESAQSN